MLRVYYKDNSYARPDPRHGIFLPLRVIHKYLQVEPEYVIELIQTGKLPVYIFGLGQKHWRVWSGDLDNFLRMNKISAPSQEEMEQIRKEILSL